MSGALNRPAAVGHIGAQLVVEEFASYPSTVTLMQAYSEQEQWEGDKKSILLEHFRSDIDYGARGANPKQFLKLHNKDANLASTRYVPSGSYTGYGVAGRHDRETRSQFELRMQADADLSAQASMADLSRGTRSVPGSRAGTPFGLSGAPSAVDPRPRTSMASLGLRHPRPITPGDFPDPWLSAGSGSASDLGESLASAFGGSREAILPKAAQEAQDKRYPRPDESGGFKRSVLRRLAATATQVQKRTQQARSSQYYPSLAVLVADVVEASGLDQDGDANTVAILDDTFVKFRELAEVHYQAKSLQVAGNKFCALGGVRYSTASSCIGGGEEPTPDGEPEGVMLGADDLPVSWGERSLEATTSFLEGRYERLSATASRQSMVDAGGTSESEVPEPTNGVLDQIVQLGLALQRCVAHMNDEAAAGRATRPRLAVRIGIALGPASTRAFCHYAAPYPFCMENPYMYSKCQ